MSDTLFQIQSEVYTQCGFKLKNVEMELESQNYQACQFKLDGLTIICRTAKITPKKSGQFVTFWKRSVKGPITPFETSDNFDFFIVNVQSDNKIGQFIFPKSVLLKKGIISTEQKEGKRAFRVYPPWNKTTSKQAEQTQKWQVNYFYDLRSVENNENVKALFRMY